MKVQQTPNLQLLNSNTDLQSKHNSLCAVGLVNPTYFANSGHALIASQYKNQNTNFKGAEFVTQFLNFLDTNQTIGAAAVDACCMGIPRTTVDFTRGPDAGFETARREFSTNINNVMVGPYGAVAALILASALNNKYDVKANKMFISNESLDILSQLRNKHGDLNKSGNLNNYLEEIFKNTKAFNPHFPEQAKIDGNGWVNLDSTAQKDVVKKFATELQTNDLSKESRAYLKAIISDSTGSEKNFKLEHGKLSSQCSLDTLIDNVHKVTKAFMKPQVNDTFKSAKLADNSFVAAMKNLNKRTAILGLGIGAIIGASLQPINVYITKKKTGKTGFVGVDGREQDNSTSFKMLKYGIGIVGAFAALRTIGKFKASELMQKLQFKGFLPTIDQFKLVYGATIVSRIFSSRDKNELRETSIKDTLGFASWLILGGFVSKLAAFGFQSMDKFKNDKFIRYNEKENGTGWFNKLIKSSIVSREEVLHSALKKAGISTIKDGKAMSLKEMLQAAAKHAPEAKTKVKYLGFIQFAGYLYSGLALGVGIPKLNIAITNHFQKQQTANSK